MGEGREQRREKKESMEATLPSDNTTSQPLLLVSHSHERKGPHTQVHSTTTNVVVFPNSSFPHPLFCKLVSVPCSTHKLRPVGAIKSDSREITVHEHHLLLLSSFAFRLSVSLPATRLSPDPAPCLSSRSGLTRHVLR